MAIQLEEIRARLIADTAQFQAALKQADGSVSTLTGNIPRATRTLNSLKQGLSTIAFQAAGIPGPVGKVTSSLLAFGAGTVATTGLVAAVGGLALAFNALDKPTKMVIGDAQALTKAWTEQAEATKTATERLEDLRKKTLEVGPQIEARLVGALGLLESKFPGITNALDPLIHLFANWRTRAAAAAVETAALAKETLDLAEAAKLAREILLDLSMIPPVPAGVGGLPDADRIRFPFGPAEGGPPVDPKFLNEMAFGPGLTQEELLTKGLILRMKNAFSDQRLNEALGGLGRNLGHVLVEGILDGFKDMEAILKSVLTALLNFAISYGLSQIGGGAGGFLGSFGGVPNASVVGPASMDFNVNTGTLPAPASAFDVARDAHWQRVLRESALVARSNGFRFT